LRHRPDPEGGGEGEDGQKPGQRLGAGAQEGVEGAVQDADPAD
jgi:hypothetical protein